MTQPKSRRPAHRPPRPEIENRSVYPGGIVAQAARAVACGRRMLQRYIEPGYRTAPPDQGAISATRKFCQRLAGNSLSRGPIGRAFQGCVVIGEDCLQVLCDVAAQDRGIARFYKIVI